MKSCNALAWSGKAPAREQGRTRLIGDDAVSWDATLPGFGLRSLPSGRRTWIVVTRIKGKVTKISLGNAAVVTEHEARTKAQLLILEAKVKRDPLLRKRQARATPLFAEFAYAYRRYGVSKWKPSTLAIHDRYMRNHLSPAFGRRFLDQIDEPCVFEWFTRTSRTTPGAANRALAILGHMFVKAAEWGDLATGANPCVGVRPNAGKVFRRYLDDAELQRLGKVLDELEEIHPVQTAAVRMLLYTGCRTQEILSLRWSDITGRIMTLRDTKSGPRRVELGQAAQEALGRVERQPRNPWVFVNPKRPRERLDRVLPFWHNVVLPRARIEPLRVHDLRHTFASHAAIQQENTPMIAKMLGHASTDMAQRYMHLADWSALDAADFISEILWLALSTA